MQLTIFTPTYNRAHFLSKLYESLVLQNIYSFVWLIVDDGSTDETQELIRQFKSKSPFTIKYIRQENQGKHKAFNVAVENTTTDLFLTIDSDDTMMENSLEKISELLPFFLEDQNLAAICFPLYSGNVENAMTNKKINFDQAILNSIELKNKYGITGEFSYLFKKDILKQFPFPQFSKEKFIKESVVYKRIDRIYKNLYVNLSIVKGEYLEGGLSSDFRKLLERNPVGSALAYLETVNDDRLSLEEQKEAFRNYWYFAKLANQYSTIERLFKVKNKSIIFNFLLQKLK
ncbi:glycosyltransferase family 2 protein [Chryseobacterium sp. GP-SGM7]|uniref:glycosyltransferase family 2 protein n=1 Tax=Chryseobacterium sp. GP-SGM7 TaxID=3411323 RepID=UPI003B941DDF